MKKLTILLLILTAVGLTGACAHRDGVGPGSPPVIDKIGASSQAGWGENWRIYVKAHDPDGDMAQTRFKVVESRYYQMGTYSYVRVPGEYGTEMNGYYVVDIRNTPLELGDGIDLVVTFQLADEAGNTSRKARLPLNIRQQPVKTKPEGFSDNMIGMGPPWFLN